MNIMAFRNSIEKLSNFYSKINTLLTVILMQAISNQFKKNRNCFHTHFKLTIIETVKMAIPIKAIMYFIIL